MKKRILSMFLAGVMALTLLPAAGLAAGRNYGEIPIYVGYSDVDYLAEELLKEIPTQGKSAVGQIRAVYDWILENGSADVGDGTRYFDEKETAARADEFFGQANAAVEKGDILIRPEWEEQASSEPAAVPCDSNQYIANYAYEMMLYRAGGSAHDAALLALLLGHLGFDCRVIAGSDSSGEAHMWNYVLVDGQYCWLDVRMDRAEADSAGDPDHRYFLVADDGEWARSHRWEDGYSSWLNANSAAIAEEYGYSAALLSGEPWSRCSEWAEGQMALAYGLGLIPERLQNQDLTAEISRAEFASVAVTMYERLTGTEVPAYAGQNPFTDTEDADVLRAYSLGVVKGIGGGLYAPDSTLTREQAMTMLGRVWELAETGAVGDGSGLPHDNVRAFGDDGSISDYARDYIYFFVAQGVVNGVGGNLLAPLADMTREAAVKMTVEAAESW